MPRWSDRQGAFAAGLAPEMPPPGRIARASRFAVYRNNVAVALIDALRTRFPVTERLVGSEFFIALAQAYIAAHRPTSPMLFAYGDGLADALAAAPGLDEAPFVADVARLEALRTESYHAADAVPLDLAALAGLTPDALDHARLAPHPALRLLRSPWPAAAIWHAHQGDGEPEPPETWAPEAIAVVRPEADVLVHVLPEPAFAVLAALAEGETLATAAEAGLAADPAFDFGATLVRLVQIGAFQSIGD